MTNENNENVEESDLFDSKPKAGGEKKSSDHVVYGQVANGNPVIYTKYMTEDELRATIQNKQAEQATRKVAVGRLGVLKFAKAMGTDEKSISEALTRLFLKVYVQGKTAQISPEGIEWIESTEASEED